MRNNELESILKVFISLQPMKELKRQGGIYYGERMAEADTIAGHSYTVACLSWLLTRMLKREFSDLSVEKVLTLGLLHDMGEAMTGDIGTAVKASGMSTLETQAVAQLLGALDGSEELTNLHREYEELASREAGIVKVADRLDAWAHALATPSVHGLINAWRFYNKRVYEKIRSRNSSDPFWQALGELFRMACVTLRDSQVILLNEKEREFDDPDW